MFFCLWLLAEPHRVVVNALVAGRLIHTAPQEQMDAPDTSGAESLALQAVIEAGDGVFGHLHQRDAPDSGENVAVDQVAVSAHGAAAPSAPVLAEPAVALTHCKKRNKAEIYLCKSCAATVLWKSSEMLGDPRQAVKGKHKGKLCSIPHSIHRPGVRPNRPGRYQILHE